MQKQLINPNEVGVFALGGLGEVGKNMYVMEYKDEIIIIDSGFLFPDDYLVGIDYVIPDYTYLRENESKIKGLFISHGHEDHIGGLPFLLQQIKIPTIYANGLALGLIKAKLTEYPRLSYNLKPYKEDDIIRFNHLKVTFFRTNHSIPDSFGIIVYTPNGPIIHTGDFKFDFSPTANDTNYHKIAAVGAQGVKLLLSDSTNSELDDFTVSEKVVSETIKDLFATIDGRIIIATFASNIHRIQQIIEASIEAGRRVAIFGRSMERNVEVGLELGYIKAPKKTFVRTRNLNRIKSDKLTVLCTGSQGEPFAALTRIADKTHRQIKLRRGDTVILSSSAIPGNVESINNTINLLSKQGADVITQSPFADVHASGHGGQNEMKLMLKLIKPEHFIPIHGEYRMLKMHAKLAEDTGVKKKNIFVLDNGQVLAVSKDGARIAGKVQTDDVYVDGSAIGETGTEVIRERRNLSEDGLLSVVVTLNTTTKKILNDPSIISKGFLFLKDSQTIIKEMEKIVVDITNKHLNQKGNVHLTNLKNDLTRSLGRYIHKKTDRDPMVMPVIMTP